VRLLTDDHGTASDPDTAGAADVARAATEPAAAQRPHGTAAPSAGAGILVAGWGTALPDRTVTNDELATFLDTSDEWIVERSGIHERRWVGPGESTRPLAVTAARRALDRAGLEPADLDVVVVATTTPDTPVPSTASQVAADLGITAGAFDLNAACAGFVYALTIVSSLVSGGAARTALVVGADTMTSILDTSDRSTAVLFGDGAGALVLTSAAGGGPGGRSGAPDSDGDRSPESPVPGLVASDLVGDPGGVDLLVVPAGGSARPASAETVAAREHYVRMDGREVFRRAVRAAEASIGRTLDRAGCAPDDVRLFVPHQANARITDAVLARTGLPAARTCSTIGRMGNTSAASIPIALAESADADTVSAGDLVLMCGFGAGLTVGTVLWRWATTPPPESPKDARR
jgi:3-oxoacyl-[acyl-carrier-protein] synthase-3